MNRILEAARYARLIHSTHKRKWTNKPAITHIERVAGRVMTHLDHEDDACIAWLHDTIEDTYINGEPDPTVEREIIDYFGGSVFQGVKGLTNKSKDRSDLPRHQRKEIDRGKLVALAINLKIIKLIDRIDNLTDPGFALAPEAFRKIYCEESSLLREALRRTTARTGHDLCLTYQRLDEELSDVILDNVARL